MSTATLGQCVGKCHVPGQTKPALVFDTDEPDWFIVVTAKGARFRRRRDQIFWRK